MNKLDMLCTEMVDYFSGDPKRIQHFLKVHSLAALIGRCEGLPEKELFTLEAAAYVHDCGIKPAEEKFGSCSGKLQEQEGPSIARELLTKLEFDDDITERVCYLVGRHHTYKDIDGLDCQILIEADFLVNLYEDGLKESSIITARDRVFRTETGISILESMFGI